MRKPMFMIALFFILAMSLTAHATGAEYGPEGKRFGAGIIAGEPTGITLKGYLTRYLGINVIGSWSFVDDAATIISDVTYDFFDIPVETAKVTVPFYAGAGMKLAVHSKHKGEHKTRVGIRIPIGVAVQWTGYPIEVLFEIGPGVQVAPETKFDISGGIGARFYFF